MTPSQVATIAHAALDNAECFDVAAAAAPGGVSVNIDYRRDTEFVVSAAGFQTPGDAIPPATHEAMRKLAREIYADIKPWLEPK